MRPAPPIPPAPLVGGKRRRGAVSAQARARSVAGPGPPAGARVRAGLSAQARAAGFGRSQLAEVRTRGSFWQKADEPGPARGLVGGLKEVKWRTWRTKVGEAPSGASWRPGNGRRETEGPQARGLSTPECGGLCAPGQRPSGPHSRPPLRPLRLGSPARPITPGPATVRPEGFERPLEP